MSLTANEQFLLELINRARLDPQAEAARYGLSDLNRGMAPGTITGDPLQPLAYSDILQAAARAHSQWMLDTDIFNHTGANGSSPTDRMIAAGYDFRGTGYDGGAENISRRGTTGTLDLAAEIDSHHSGLFLSDGHRRNTFGADWSEVGLAQVQGVFTNNGNNFNTSMLTQNFAPSTRVFVTGVVYADSDKDQFYSRGEGAGGVGVSLAGGQQAQSAAAGGYTLAVASGATTATLTIGNAVVAVDVSAGNAKVDLIDSATIASSADIWVRSGVSTVRLLGAGNIDATGSSADELLIGTRGANRLAGGGGADTLQGGQGDDVYVDPQGALIVELAGGGLDTIESSRDYDLANQPEIENLRLIGTAHAAAAGNALDNLVSGNDGDNRLTGGGGRDTLAGGAGDDVYFDLDGDQVLELQGQGIDTIQSVVSIALADYRNVENVVLLGAAGVHATGDGGANRLVGNAGANRLDGGAGDDVLEGGAGADTLVAGGGADRLIGGSGDDVYYISRNSIVIEAAGGGTDTIHADYSVSVVDLTNIENVTLIGGASLSAAGDARHNHLTGNAGANVLTGGVGNDTLEGGAGTDTLIGGAGADTYRVEGMGDQIVELNAQGFDRVVSDGSFSLATLGSIERLELVGSVPGFLRGNANGNTLIGNTGSNTILGFAGDDTILGFGGRDTITGGLGRDIIAPGLERDTVKWDTVTESTGVSRDSVSEFVFSSGGAYERLDFSFIPTDVRETITSGNLGEKSFDADLQAAVTAARLGVGEAVLFDPSGGDLNLAGHIYLIVDANGVAGYQANADYLVQFSNSHGTLTLANFI